MPPITQVECNVLVASIKTPDNDNKLHRVILRAKPSNANYESWEGAYLCQLGYLYTLFLQRHKFLNKWTVQLMHKSRQYDEIILRRIDNAAHHDKVTGENFDTHRGHVHIYIEDWRSRGYSRHDGYAIYPERDLYNISEGLGHMLTDAHIVNTQSLIQERLL